MFGLEKGKKKEFKFFDLEKDLESPKKSKDILKKVEKHIQELKNHIRKGADSKEFEKLGILLHGYSALMKTLTKSPNS